MLADIRYAFRLFWKAPAFVFAAVTTLALGIGANVAIFSLIDRVILRPLDVGDPERLLVLEHQTGSTSSSRYVLYDDYLKSRTANSTVDGVAGYGGQRLVRVTWGDYALMTPALFVSANYFDVLGVSPHRGRLFLASDDTASTEPVAVLTERSWRARFGADPSTIGRTISVSGFPVRIVGVAQPGFSGTELGSRPSEIFFPIESARQLIVTPENLFGTVTSRGYSPTSWFTVIFRLRDTATREQALAEFTSISRRDRETLIAIPIQESVIPVRSRDDIVQFTSLLAGAVMLILFIACANMASLLLARIEDRKTELAVRAALGAGRVRVLRQLFVEAAVVSVAGGFAALFVAAFIGPALQTFRLPGGIGLAGRREGFDLRLVVFAILLTTLTAIVCGVGPALVGARRDVVADLKRHAAAVSPALRSTRVLIAVQVALCVVLLMGGVVFIRSVSTALASKTGFDVHDLIVANPIPLSVGYSEARALDYSTRVFDTIARIPGVRQITTGPAGLGAGGYYSTPEVRIDAISTRLSAGALGESQPSSVFTNFVGPRYFSTLGLPIVRGRDFTAADDAAGATVAIVSEALARRFWPNESAVGHHIGFLPLRVDLEVVGVSRDVKYVSLRDTGRLSVYAPMALWPSDRSQASILIRAPGATEQVIRAVYRAGAQVDPNVPLGTVTTVEERMHLLLMPQRLGRALMSGLSIVALVVTIVGIYGLIAGVVARSTREVGIRIALGADRWEILKRTTISAVMPVALGMATGAVAAVWASRFADRFIYGMGAADPWTLVSASAVLLAIATGAVLIPARRALTIDPVDVLRSE